MEQTLDESKWESLAKRIGEGKCTPFLGAGVNDKAILPLGSAIAEQLADKYKYPLDDKYDLARVAQYRAITGLDAMDVKDEMIRTWFTNVQPPNFSAADEPLGLLAELPIPLYMTTNYDSLLFQALESKGKKPKREFCRWNNHPDVAIQPSVWDNNAGFCPTKKEPVVYHLHGIDEVTPSLVLTEDDYVDFLVSISQQQQNKILPPFVQRAIAGTSLIFIGYRMADWTFRVLFRGLLKAVESGLRRMSVAVQLPPETPEVQRESVQGYLKSYYGNMSTLVYWGTAKEFTKKLRESCEKQCIIPKAKDTAP